MTPRRDDPLAEMVTGAWLFWLGLAVVGFVIESACGCKPAVKKTVF